MSGDLSPPLPGNKFSSGIQQSSKINSEVTDARKLNLPSISRRGKPLRSFSTRKPRITSLPSCTNLAQTTATSEIEPLVIQRLVPLRTNPPCSLLARGIIPPGLEPKSGSVRPKQPTASAEARRGSQKFFCASEPKV